MICWHISMQLFNVQSKPEFVDGQENGQVKVP